MNEPKLFLVQFPFTFISPPATVDKDRLLVAVVPPIKTFPSTKIVLSIVPIPNEPVAPVTPNVKSPLTYLSATLALLASKSNKVLFCTVTLYGTPSPVEPVDHSAFLL